MAYGIAETHSEDQRSNLEVVPVAFLFGLGVVRSGASELVKHGLNNHKYETRERHCHLR
jgi:hypothetical protein